MQHEALSQWQFVVAAYGAGLGATVILLAQSWRAMRKAEARRDSAREASRERGREA